MYMAFQLNCYEQRGQIRGSKRKQQEFACMSTRKECKRLTELICYWLLFNSISVNAIATV